MFRRTFILLFAIVVLIIFNSGLIAAPGIGGAVLERLFFKPGLEKTYVYHATSNTVRTMDHDVNMNGDLCTYFTLSTNVLEDMIPGETRTFEAKMKLPQQLDPGEHRCYICVTESEGRVPEGAGTGIGTIVRVCAVISVLAPYPGKNITVTFNVADVQKGENATFLLDVLNSGTETVDVAGTIDIFSEEPVAGKETRIVTLKTKSYRIESGVKAALNASFNTSELDIGEYKAKATVAFDGKEDIKEKTFRVGELDVDIIGITEEVPQNKLAPVNVQIESKWKGPIKGVYATLDITSLKRNVKVATIKTAPYDLAPWEKKNLVAYWDTTGIEPGEYNVKVTLNYEGKTKIKDEKLRVREYREGIGVSPMIIAIIILIIVVIILIVLVLRLLSKMQEQRKSTKKSVREKRKIKKH